MTFLNINGMMLSLNPGYRVHPNNKERRQVVGHQLLSAAFLSLTTCSFYHNISAASLNERKSLLVTSSQLQTSGHSQIHLPLMVMLHHKSCHDHT